MPSEKHKHGPLGNTCQDIPHYQSAENALNFESTPSIIEGTEAIVTRPNITQFSSIYAGPLQDMSMPAPSVLVQPTSLKFTEESHNNGNQHELLVFPETNKQSGKDILKGEA